MQTLRNTGGIYRVELSPEDRQFLAERIEARRRHRLWASIATSIRREPDPVERMSRCAAAIGAFSRDAEFNIGAFTRACFRREG